MSPSILRALRIVIAADSDPARQVLFGNLMQARLAVRLAFRAHAAVAGTPASTLLVAGYGLAYFLRITPPAAPRGALLGVAKHANARRQVQRIIQWVGDDACGHVGTKASASGVAGGLALLATAPARRTVRRAVRVIRRIERRHGFLVTCRAAAALAWYGRSRHLLASRGWQAVLVSSDSNPEEVGFTAAAATLGIPRVFVSHAYPTPFAPRLDFTLSILEGEAAVLARSRKGPIGGLVVLAGVEGESRPLDAARFTTPAPVIGIFTPKALSWTTFARIIAECRATFAPRRIVIRWHPSRLDTARHLQALGDLAGIEESSAGATLDDVARGCDWVIADENSNVHLPVLKMGIPTVVVKGLGLYPPTRADLYGFAAARVVYPPVTSIHDVDPQAFTAFFDEAWVRRFRQYDAAYLRPVSDVRREVCLAIDRALRAVPELPAHV